MKKAIQILLLCVLLFFLAILGIAVFQTIQEKGLSLNFSDMKTSAQSTTQFNGTVAIGLDYKVDYGQNTLGYTFLQEIDREGEYGATKTNLFGAKNASIQVSDSSGKIIGLFNADSQGSFSFNVDTDDYYQLFIKFQNIEKSMTIKASEANNLKIYLGYINVATGEWSEQ
ncbi:hypothetical protein [Paenibacillus xylanilyticus]|uniref:hypothetical protein n=1 Tax=Paenibacillus xylanilyticus TaxID=248903 RepID=UPI00399EFBB2